MNFDQTYRNWLIGHITWQHWGRNFQTGRHFFCTTLYVCSARALFITADVMRWLSQWVMSLSSWVHEWERESAPLSRSRMASPWADNTEKGWGKVPEVAFRASSVWFGSATSGLIGWVLCNFFPRDWVKRTSVTRGSYIGKPNSRNLLERKLHFRVGCTPHFSPKRCVNLVLAV